MFFGNSVNVARFDKQKFPIFEKLTEKQLSFFWRPEEVDLSKDKIDFAKLNDIEKHIFLSNLKYQTLLDSIQGRSPNIAFLPIVSLPELENWIETWSFYETIHSRSYTYIIRAIETNPGLIFDDIMQNKAIIKRAENVSARYDDFIKWTQLYLHGVKTKTISLDALKRNLYLTLMSVNILEGILFYVSFACSFVFAENALMEGNAKIIKLIARDEALHLAGTQHMLKIMQSGKDDADMLGIAKSCKGEARNMFMQTVNQEKAWIDYLFKDGSMLGLNAEVLKQYLQYITNVRMQAIGLEPLFDARPNPLPWINHWLDSDAVQVAPQETEETSYLVGAIDNNILDDADFGGFKL